MNKSIYKKQLAFKNSLPQYGNGGKKVAAGLAGFAKNIPMLGQVIDPLVANTDAVKDNPVAYASGNLVGSTAKTIGMGIVNPLSLASNVPQTIGAGLNVGSAVATEKGNLDTTQGLNTASTALTGLGSVAGMATGVAGGMGNIPIKMKDGGSIHIDPAKRGTFKAQATRMGMGVQEAASKILNAPEGTYSPEMRKKANFAANSASWNKKEFGGYVEEFKDGGMIKRADGSYSKRGLWDNIRANKGSGKEPTKEMLEQERKIKAKMQNGGKLPKEVLLPRLESHMSSEEANNYINQYGDGGYTVTKSNDRKGKTHKVTGPDGTVKYFGDPNLGEKDDSKYGKEAFYARHKKNLDANPYFRAYARATWRDGGMIPQYPDGGNLIKYNLPTHEDGGGAIDANGKLVNPNSNLAQAELEKKETLDTNQNYVFSDTLKPMKSKITFADLSRKIDSKYKDRNDDIAKATKAKELENLAMQNEEMRLAKEAKSNPLKMKNGGNLPKYNDGAYFNPYGLGSGTVNTFGTTPTESMNTMTPSVMLGNTTIPSIKDRSNKNFTNTNTETINSSLFPTKNRFAPATMNNPNLAGNKTNPNLLPINNPIIPTQSGMSQRRAVDFGSNFDRTNPFKADKADTGSIFSQPGVAGGALKNVPSTLYNLGVGLFGKVQKTPPVLTQRTEKIGPVRFGTNEMDLEANRQMAAINQGSTSDAVRRANLQSLSLGNQRLKGELAQKEALANVGIQEQNQARALQENLTDQKAIQLAQQLNISAEQAKKLALQEGIAGIGEIMDDTSKQKIAYGENQLGFGALQTMFSNWKLKNPGGTYSSFLKSIGKGGGAIEFVS
jgi:hypothetical protein